MALDLPKALAANAERRGRSAWLTTLEGTLDDLAGRWSLEIGPPFQPGGQGSWVAPVRSAVFGEVVLKVAHRSVEALDEAKGLLESSGSPGSIPHGFDYGSSPGSSSVRRTAPPSSGSPESSLHAQHDRAPQLGSVDPARSSRHRSAPSLEVVRQLAEYCKKSLNHVRAPAEGRKGDSEQRNQ